MPLKKSKAKSKRAVAAHSRFTREGLVRHVTPTLNFSKSLNSLLKITYNLPSPP